MKMHWRLHAEISVLMLALLAATLAGCSGAAARREARSRENFIAAQHYRKQALYANEHGNSADAVRYLQMAQMREPLGRPALPPPRSTLFLPQHRPIAPAGGQVTCHSIGINRFACF